MNKIKYRKIYPDAIAPTKDRESDAGYDLYAYLSEDVWLNPGESYQFGTGLEIALPDTVINIAIGHQEYPNMDDLGFGPDYVMRPVVVQHRYHAFLWDRSGMGFKKKIHRLAGVIDNCYRGEWKVALVNHSFEKHCIKHGDKIVQFVPTLVPHFETEEVDELDETDRGSKGFGSSG